MPRTFRVLLALSFIFSTPDSSQRKAHLLTLLSVHAFIWATASAILHLQLMLSISDIISGLKPEAFSCFLPPVFFFSFPERSPVHQFVQYCVNFFFFCIFFIKCDHAIKSPVNGALTPPAAAPISRWRRSRLRFMKEIITRYLSCQDKIKGSGKITLIIL